jgi:hypothetical protein
MELQVNWENILENKMVNEKHLLSRLLAIRRIETNIRSEFDSGLTLIAGNYLAGKQVKFISADMKDQRKLMATALMRPYQSYLELKEEAQTASPDLVRAIDALANQLGDELVRYG